MDRKVPRKIDGKKGSREKEAKREERKVEKEKKEGWLKGEKNLE